MPSVLPSQDVSTGCPAQSASPPVHEAACDLSEDASLRGKRRQERPDFGGANLPGQDSPAVPHAGSDDAVKSSKSSQNSRSVGTKTPALPEYLNSSPAHTAKSEHLDQGLKETKDTWSEKKPSRAAAEASPSLEDQITSKEVASLADKASNQRSPSPTTSRHGKDAPSDLASSSSASLDGDGMASATESQEDTRQPVDKADQVSIEIVRCRAVCPDWQDSALKDSASNGRPDTLVLAIPHLLLQLPPSNPALHPSCHPVQVWWIKTLNQFFCHKNALLAMQTHFTCRC